MDLFTMLAAGTGAVAAVVAAPVALTAIGFTAGGITAGSFAAFMMSWASIGGGGGVAVGSLVAILQSAGAAGIPFIGNAIVGAVGATVGAVVNMFSHKLTEDLSFKFKLHK